MAQTQLTGAQIANGTNGVNLTVDVTGTLPVANGGTGVTSSTGSGANVLTNNPSLVSPSLGTPSSVVLTNATGLPTSGLVNGSVTPSKLATGALETTVPASENTTSTTYTDLTTATDTVTVSIGSNGLALVIISGDLFNTTSGAWSYMSFSVSGATTVAASDIYALGIKPNTNLPDIQSSSMKLMSGLAIGSTTFKAKYRTTAGTAYFTNRRICVIPL